MVSSAIKLQHWEVAAADFEDILADCGLPSADEHKKVEPRGVGRIE